MMHDVSPPMVDSGAAGRPVSRPASASETAANGSATGRCCSAASPTSGPIKRSMELEMEKPTHSYIARDRAHSVLEPEATPPSSDLAKPKKTAAARQRLEPLLGSERCARMLRAAVAREPTFFLAFRWRAPQVI